jgi:hypothetical protein
MGGVHELDAAQILLKSDLLWKENTDFGQICAFSGRSKSRRAGRILTCWINFCVSFHRQGEIAGNSAFIGLPL